MTCVRVQAMDRIHRLGQFKPIRVVRFVVEDTVEDRILRLQVAHYIILYDV
jgi:DNA repair protein RAD16